MSLSFTYPYPAPSSKGWGPGWPDCQRDKIVPHAIFQGGVHEEIRELVDLLVAESERRGFVFRDGWSWGLGCRGKKTSSGSQGDEASVHSWGLAVDINAPLNVFGSEASRSQLATEASWLPVLWRRYGFLWLGPSIRDWMHLHFAGDRDDAKRMTDKARRELAGDMGNEEDDEMFELWRAGWEAHEAGKDANKDWPNMKKEGWRARNKLLAQATGQADPE